MAWQGKGWNGRPSLKPFFLPSGRKGRVRGCRGAETLNRALVGLTGGFTTAFNSRGASVWLLSRANKQMADIRSLLMIAENLARRGPGQLHCGLPGHRGRIAPRTNRNMVGS